MNKVRHEILIVTICFILLCLFSACKEQKPKSVCMNFFVQDSNQTFLIKTKYYKNVEQIEYPFLVSIDKSYAADADLLNELIFSLVDSHVKEYIDSLNGEVFLRYEVTSFNQNFISVVFSLSYTADNMAHPTRELFTCNIDLKNKKYITLKDVVTLNDEIAESILKTENIISPTLEEDQKLALSLAEFPFSLDMEQRLEALNSCDSLTVNALKNPTYPLYSYYEMDSIYLCMRIPYALGSNLIFKYPLKSIPK